MRASALALKRSISSQKSQSSPRKPLPSMPEPPCRILSCREIALSRQHVQQGSDSRCVSGFYNAAAPQHVYFVICSVHCSSTVSNAASVAGGGARAAHAYGAAPALLSPYFRTPAPQAPSSHSCTLRGELLSALVHLQLAPALGAEDAP